MTRQHTLSFFFFGLAMSARDRHSSYDVGLQLVPFSRLSSPPPPTPQTLLANMAEGGGGGLDQQKNIQGQDWNSITLFDSHLHKLCDIYDLPKIDLNVSWNVILPYRIFKKCVEIYFVASIFLSLFGSIKQHLISNSLVLSLISKINFLDNVEEGTETIE